ncbi:NAD(P)-binding protein [Cadophora sp. DSE1049]|nr:NAD(P)-binding protein [Cadophora sp. DSE1049]
MTSGPPINNGVTFTKVLHHDTYPFIDPTKVNHAGHYVFISGGSKGVGRATAIAFAQAGAGGIALGARSDFGDIEKEIATAAQKAGKQPPRVLKLKLDVMDYSSVEAAAKETEKEFGKLDILINNAGYLSKFKPLLEADMDEHWRNFEINLRGTYFMTRAFLPLMLKGGEKTIINVASRGAHMTFPGGGGYQTTKFALLRFAEFLTAEYGEQGLLTYTVHPTSAMTELGSNMPENAHHLLVDTLQIASDTMCFLTAERREWLAGRYVDCGWDMPEFLSREKEIVEGGKLVMRMVF